MIDLHTMYFVSRRAAPDRETAERDADALHAELADRHARGENLGFELALIASEADYETEGLVVGRAGIDAITGGELPFIWLNVTVPATADQEAMTNLAAQFDLVPVVMVW